jgi:AcrR family transcriptional regulator
VTRPYVDRMEEAAELMPQLPPAAIAGAGSTGHAAADRTLGRRAATKVANRAAIVAAARVVFAEMGYGSATVRDVVRRTGLASGTFYNYFSDKQSLFRAVLEESAAEVRARVRTARRQAESLEEFVAAGYREYFGFLASEPEAFELMSRNSGTIRAMFDEPIFGAGVDELAVDLRAAIAAGIVPALDADYMAAAMVGAALEVGVAMVKREPPDVEGATRFATSVLLGGIERLGRGL